MPSSSSSVRFGSRSLPVLFFCFFFNCLSQLQGHRKIGQAQALKVNGVFDAVELKMLEELAKKGAITNKRFSDKKKYLKELVRLLYLNL